MFINGPMQTNDIHLNINFDVKIEQQKVNSLYMNEFIFSCTSDSPKSIAKALISIDWKEPENQSCSVSVSKAGILFLTEDVSVLQANVLLASTMFRQYSLLTNTSYDFHINLTYL